MGFASEVGTMTVVNIKALPQRIGAALVTVIGVATTVAVMISLLAIGAGIQKTSLRNVPADQVVVLPSDAVSESVGTLARSVLAIVSDAPGVRRSSDGRALVEPTATVIVEVIRKADGAPVNLQFRGVGPMIASVQPGFRIIEGRWFRPGLNEIIVGTGARAQFRKLGLGDTIVLRGLAWRVVGVFKDGGSMSENAIISDIDTVLAAFGRDAYGNILVRLQSTDAFVTFKDALSRNPQLAVDVRWQRDHLKDQSKTITRVFNFLGWFVGSVMGLGAVFGGVTTMYAIVDARTREIATLRAIGFSSSAVVISVLVESTLLAVPGALLGYAAAWLVFNGRAVSTVGLSFPLAVTPGLAVWALALSLAIGLIGGLAPAIRVARMSVVTGLRAM